MEPLGPSAADEAPHDPQAHMREYAAPPKAGQPPANAGEFMTIVAARWGMDKTPSVVSRTLQVKDLAQVTNFGVALGMLEQLWGPGHE